MCTSNKARGWNQSVATYNTSQQVTRVNNCFAIMFTNLGDVVAYVNDCIIYPTTTNPISALGDSRSIGAHKDDLYLGNITLKFQAPTTGVAPLVEIIQLFYTDEVDFKKV